MDVTVSELMANFLDSPLVVWVKTLGPLGNVSEDKLSMFMDLVDGVFLHKIMTQIDPSPTNQRVNKHVNNDINLRAQNLKIIIRHIKNYYQENLQQLVVMNLPNALSISKDPLSAKSMEEMNRLLLLMLGCAVQCDRKEEFIEKIKLLDIETQAAIVTHIQEVTHNQENVLDLQWLELADLPSEELDPLSRSMALHLRRLIDERDDCVEAILELTQERDYLQSQRPATPPLNHGREHPPGRRGPVAILGKEDRQHLSVELADSKARLRRSRQELEEKTEQLMDAKHEIERLDLELQKLKQESMQLLTEARSARVYRDELDALRERAGRVDRLETELTRCKERLHDVHFYKTRVEELREDNLTLMETKALLEEQLSGARGRCDKLHELEKENLQLRSKLHDVEMERDVDKKRLEELLEENMMLEISQKQSMNESAHLGWELEQLAKSNDSGEARKSFVFELNESALSRLLKLEKENQGLQSRVEELREASLNLDQAQLRTQELEKENNQLNEKMEKLQVLLEQEKQATHDMGNLGEELLKDKQKLEKALEAAQADKDRQAQELEHLNQAVASLRKRAQEDSEARVREVEAENRALHQTISDTGGRLAQAEAEARRVAGDLERALELAERTGRLEEEVARLEGAREELQRQAAALPAARQRAEALERENGGLEQDNRRLKKRADAAQNAALRLGALEEERRQLEAENLELRRAADRLRPAAARLPRAEAEREELQRERDALAQAADELRPLAKKAERLELSCAALDGENRRLQGCLEGGRAEAQALERQLNEARAEAQRLRREAEEELRPAVGRLEAAEAEKRSLEQEAGQAEKERKQAEKEARRLRQQLEAKEAALDESAARAASLEKENGALGKEGARLREAAGRAKELERDNKELQKQATIDKRTLATLREDLVSEKLKVQQQWNDLEKLSHELEKIGLNREKLLQEEHSCEDNKYKILESKIDSTMKKTLQIREEKIQGLESRLEESGNLNKQLHAELTTVKRTLEALKQRQEEQEAHSNHTQQAQLRAPPEKGEREATAELLKLKDRLIDIEKNNAALQTEKQLHREQLRQLDTQNTQLNAQILTLQRQATALQEHNTALHTQAAKLQVENATLNSQSASLMAQNAALQGQAQTLEGEAEALERGLEEARAGRDGVLQDHERLLAVHERQAAEYERLIGQHTALKGSHRGLEQEHRALENKYAVLLMQKTALEELEGTLQRERESLGEEIQKNGLILVENQSLRGEVDRVTQAHEQLTQECDRLQLQTKELKTSLNESQLELNRWQARFDQLKEQHQGLDISLTKLDNHCELLTRLKGNLEEENHHLLSQIQMLSQQNQTLLERTMESKELYHEEQKQYIDKLNALRRQKEKLEEKIMDQYKFYDPAPKKRNHWAGAKALAKFIKPKKESSRERVRGVSETSRPTSPADGLDGPLPPPPPPPRQARLSLDSVEESHSLPISPAYASKGRSETSGSRGRDVTRLLGGGGETPNGTEEPPARRRASELGVPAYSANATSTPGHAHNSSSRHGHRPRGLSCDEDLRLQSPDATFGSSVHGNAGHRLSSAEFSRSASSSDSPVHSKDSLERLDALALGHGPRDSLLSRASPLPSETPPLRTGPRLARRRPSSPGSEMVTLEEFLQESNTLSPPTVQTGSREDLMTDYFSKVGDWPGTGRPAPLRDGAKTPTSYVTPTVKATPPGDPQALRPGQTVKPSIRLPEAATPPCHSQTLPNRPASGGRAPPQHHVGGARGSKGGLSRTFSLASADLLRSNGPDGYRQEGGGGGAWPGGDEGREDAGVVRRAGVAAQRERPQSAILAGSLHPQPGDSGHGRLSLVSPKEERLPQPQHHSSSLSLSSSPAPRDRYGARRSAGTPLHRGEVAMVTPVRAVPALRQDDKEETPEAPPPAESPLAKKWDGGGGGGEGGGNCSMEEHPKSTPASPDPNNDPQTVWYEYGCV